MEMLINRFVVTSSVCVKLKYVKFSDDFVLCLLFIIGLVTLRTLNLLLIYILKVKKDLGTCS